MAPSPSFLSQITRRKVWQVTAYLAGGLTTLLAVAELHDEFGLPEGTPRFVATLLAGGLPVTVLVEWFFDTRGDRPGSAGADPSGAAGTDEGLASDDRIFTEIVYASDSVQDHWASAVAEHLWGNLSLSGLLDGDLEVPGLKGGTFPVDHEAFVGNRDSANILTHQAFLLFVLGESRRSLLETGNEVLEALEAL